MVTANPLSHAERRLIHTRAVNAKRREANFNRTDEELAATQAELFPSGHATCRECGRARPLSAFPAHRHLKAGFRPLCLDTCWKGDTP